MLKRIVLSLSVLAVVLGCSNAPFTPAEREIITLSDSLMNVLTMPLDSAVLRAKSIDFSEKELSSPLLKTLMDKMLYTVTDPSQDGVGIAGPQVGLNRRIILVQRFDKEGEPFECYLNVRIDSLSGEIVRGPEGCLSIPGKRGIVPRRSTAHISYVYPGERERRSERVDGFPAIIFQHETDHLEGRLYTDIADTVFVTQGL